MYKITKYGSLRIEDYINAITELSNLDVDIISITNQDNNINALTLVYNNLNEIFSEEDFNSNSSLCDITSSVTIENLLSVGMIEEV
jgi:hypothetical protein